METIIQSLKATPWWVYLLFGYLVYLGLKARKPGILSVNKLFILPLIFFVWSLINLVTKFRGWLDIPIWLAAGVLGFFGGVALVKKMKKIRADKKKLLIYLPGNPMTLYLLIGVFVVKYFFGYYESIHQGETPLVVHAFDLLAMGAISGMFIGRLYMYMKKFAAAKHESLKKGGTPRKKSLL